MRTTLILALAGLLLGLQPLAAIAAPDADDLATADPGEPHPWCAPVSNTVWYRIELPRRTNVLVHTAGSDFDTVLAVYDAELGIITCNDDANGDSHSLQARLGFSAARRTTSYLQAGAYPSDVREDEEAQWDAGPADLELVLSIE